MPPEAGKPHQYHLSLSPPSQPSQGYPPPPFGLSASGLAVERRRHDYGLTCGKNFFWSFPGDTLDVVRATCQEEEAPLIGAHAGLEGKTRTGHRLWEEFLASEVESSCR
jgi:hypothetical protein